MAFKGTKIINQWQRRELIDLNGNEGISIAFDGIEGIFSKLYLPHECKNNLATPYDKF